MTGYEAFDRVGRGVVFLPSVNKVRSLAASSKEGSAVLLAGRRTRLSGGWAPSVDKVSTAMWIVVLLAAMAATAHASVASGLGTSALADWEGACVLTWANAWLVLEARREATLAAVLSTVAWGLAVSVGFLFVDDVAFVFPLLSVLVGFGLCLLVVSKDQVEPVALFGDRLEWFDAGGELRSAPLKRDIEVRVVSDSEEDETILVSARTGRVWRKFRGYVAYDMDMRPTGMSVADEIRSALRNAG